MAQKTRRRYSSELAELWRQSLPGLAAVLVFSVFINLLRFATPLYLIQVFDRVLSSRSVATLVILTIAALVALVTGTALDTIRRRMLGRWSAWLEHHLTMRSVKAGLTAGAASPPVLANIENISKFVSRGLAPWLDVVWAPVFFLCVYLVHPILGLISAVGVALLIGLSVLKERFTRGPRQAQRDAVNEAREVLISAERNREVVSAFAMADAIAGRWGKSRADSYLQRERLSARGTSFDSAARGLSRGLYIVLIAFGIWLFLENSVTLGGVFAARILASSGFRLVEKAIREYSAARDARDSYTKIQTELSKPVDQPVSLLPGTRQGRLTLDEVTYRYSGFGGDVFRRLSLTLAPGELLLVVGRAATGKTTLSRLLIGVLSPRSGLVRLGDMNISALADQVRSELIGYLPQQVELLNGTIAENIARFQHVTMEEVVSAAKIAGIHDAIVRLSKGYDTQLDDSVGMSGSEKKRIALARALFRLPRLLVLDEPYANLDGPSKRALNAAIELLKRSGCSIVVTVSSPTNRLAGLVDKTLILGGGTPELTDNAEQTGRSARPSKPELRSIK